MIKQLEISNFRGFEKYHIENIGRINLLVGVNNCGKTSVLEAIRLLKSKASPTDLYAVLDHRGERIRYISENGKQTEADLCRLFYGHQLNPNNFFSIQGCNDNQKENIQATVKEILHQPDLFNKHPDSTGKCQLNIQQWFKGSEKINYDIPISPNGGMRHSFISKFRNKFEDTEITNLKFVPTDSLSPLRVVELFEKIVLTPEEELVYEALRIIEPDIMRLASLGGTQHSTIGNLRGHSRGGIFVKSEKWEQRIPIGSLGDGIGRILGLILSLVSARNGILLIDEIDTGLHHTIMSKLWEVICQTAEKLNVQVFGTTHSRDCWESLAEIATHPDYSKTEIRVHRIDRHKSKSVTFTNEEINIASNRQIEVR